MGGNRPSLGAGLAAAVATLERGAAFLVEVVDRLPAASLRPFQPAQGLRRVLELLPMGSPAPPAGTEGRQVVRMRWQAKGVALDLAVERGWGAGLVSYATLTVRAASAGVPQAGRLAPG